MKSDQYYSSARREIISAVPLGVKRILEVGCGAGCTGKAIKEREGPGTEVTGIELVSEVSEKAKYNLDRVICGDVEKLELPFENGYFDCLIYADVLEHLVDPWILFKKNIRFLREGGYVVISLPNVAHYRTFKMLWKKEWNYKDSGIFDITHLRFFALKNIKDMVSSAGLGIEKIDHIISASRSKKFFNRIFGGAILDYITEQYIVVAKKQRT